AAGIVPGLGFAVKPTVLLVFVGLAITVAALRLPRLALTGVAAGFAAAAAGDIALMGRAGVAQSFRASGMVSVGSPWRIVRTLLRVSVMSESAADDVVRVLAVLLMVCLATRLLRWLGRVIAAAAPFALVLAWLLAWPYMLPWYDALGWALLPLLPGSGLD